MSRLSDGEIIEWKINLRDLKLMKYQKVKVYNLIVEHFNTLSLQD